MTKAGRFSNTFRYIDDLHTLFFFENEIGNIYPPELVLKKTTENDNMVSYLDIGITLTNGHFCTTVFDKRETTSTFTS